MPVYQRWNRYETGQLDKYCMFKIPFLKKKKEKELLWYGHMKRIEEKRKPKWILKWQSVQGKEYSWEMQTWPSLVSTQLKCNFKTTLIHYSTFNIFYQYG